MNFRSSVSFATALAALLSACGQTKTAEPSTPSTNAIKQEVKCQGINECRGTAECASADGTHACQGLNECKGQGWVTESSKASCETKGGKVIG